MGGVDKGQPLMEVDIEAHKISDSCHVVSIVEFGGDCHLILHLVNKPYLFPEGELCLSVAATKYRILCQQHTDGSLGLGGRQSTLSGAWRFIMGWQVHVCVGRKKRK